MIKKLLVLCIVMFHLQSMCIYADDNMLMTNDSEYLNSSKVVEDINFTRLTKEVVNSPIGCFDVSDDGLIALGLEKDAINVYNADGIYLYGFAFDLDGTYYLRWNSENLIIYLVREKLAMEIVNGNDNVIYIKEVTDEWSLADPTIKYLLGTTKIFNENEYTINKDMGPFNMIAGSYSKLEIIKKDGTINTVFDVSDMYTVRLAVEFLLVVTFLIVVIFILKKTIKQYGHLRDRL